MRRTAEERQAMYQESLSRVLESDALTNYPAIFEGFAAKGIPEADILPRENVFTFNAWKAKGRYVRKGEHGVKVTTWIPMEVNGEPDEATGEAKRITIRRPRTATVFHISQTDPIQ